MYEFQELTERIIGAAIEVHKRIGPGVLESAYETCLQRELQEFQLASSRQLPVAIKYRDVSVPEAFRVDLVVDDAVIVEIKSVRELEPVHKAQLLTYLRLMDKRLGLLLNFNVPKMVNGIVRIIN